MSNFKIIGRSRQYICFKRGPVTFTKTPAKNLSTPGIGAKSLYKCYQEIGLKPGKQNFINETSLAEPSIAAISYDPAADSKPVTQRGEGKQVKAEPQIESSNSDSNTVQEGDSKLTIQNILKKFEHPIYNTQTEPGQKRKTKDSAPTKSEPKRKKVKKQSGGNEVFKFY